MRVKTALSSMYILMGRYKHSLSVNATIMVRKKEERKKKEICRWSSEPT